MSKFIKKNICVNCIQNIDLQKYIELHAQVHCNYCDCNLEEGECQAINIEQFAEYLESYIRNRYEPDMFVTKDTVLLNESLSVDTKEVLWELDISHNEEFIDDMVSLLPESRWTNMKDWYGEDVMFKKQNTLILIGNGINCAVDPSFKLAEGMQYAWEQIKGNGELVKLINKVIGSNSMPKTEEELAKIQQNILAIKQLKQVQEQLYKDLKSDCTRATKFEKEYSNYLLEIAKYFCEASKSLDKEGSKYHNFLDKLAEFIKGNNSPHARTHIANLNYDFWMYEGLLKRKIMENIYQKTYLVDGFWKDGFKANRLLVKYEDSKNYGWYLHLHGSPLFYNENENILKAGIHDDKKSADHLILCCPTQKYETIQHSELLSTYINFFKRAVAEAKNIIVIGYGGKDEHLNDIIAEYMAKDVCLTVIESKSHKATLYDWAFTDNASKDKKFERLHICNKRNSILDVDFKKLIKDI